MTSLRRWLAARTLQLSLWLMGDSFARRLLLWHVDEWLKQLESPEGKDRARAQDAGL